MGVAPTLRSLKGRVPRLLEDYGICKAETIPLLENLYRDYGFLWYPRPFRDVFLTVAFEWWRFHYPNCYSITFRLFQGS